MGMAEIWMGIYIYINYIIIIYIYTNTQLEAKLDDVLWYFTITNIGGWSSIFPAVPVYSYHDLFLVDFIYYPNYILCAMVKSWIASGLRLPRSEVGRWPLYPCRFPTILCSRSSSLSITDHLPMSLQYFLCPFGLVVNFEGIFGGCVGWLCRWFQTWTIAFGACAWLRVDVLTTSQTDIDWVALQLPCCRLLEAWPLPWKTSRALAAWPWACCQGLDC